MPASRRLQGLPCLLVTHLLPLEAHLSHLRQDHRVAQTRFRLLFQAIPVKKGSKGLETADETGEQRLLVLQDLLSGHLAKLHTGLLPLRHLQLEHVLKELHVREAPRLQTFSALHRNMQLIIANHQQSVGKDAHICHKH